INSVRRDGGEWGVRNREWGVRRWSVALPTPHSPFPTPHFLLSRRGRRAFLPRLAEFHDPDSGIDVVEKDVIAELARAPGEGHVGTDPPRVASPQSRNPAALRVEAPAHLA